MSGHSKWHSIRHKKKAVDAKRGKLFTKLIKEITVAARLGGGDPDSNPRLRAAIQAAKAGNMPKENIERAIKRGTGELEGIYYEEATYEAYGPGGVAMMIDCITDNRNRTVADIKHILERHGGRLGEPGCVSWMFQKKGLITVPKDTINEDSLIEIVIDSGAEDVKEGESEYEIIMEPSDFDSVRKSLDENGVRYSVAEITMIPQSTVRLEGKEAEQMLNLMEALEDHTDINHIYANFDIPERVMEAMG